MTEEIRKQRKEAAEQKAQEKLDREQTIHEMIQNGKSVKEVAEELNVPLRSVYISASRMKGVEV